LLDPKEYMHITWDEIVELCEERGIDPAKELIGVCRHYGIPYRFLLTTKPEDLGRKIAKYKEDIEKYLLLV
jgi:hypothetical protein